jgi:uncharacterized protein YyaL (SSP411 family)
LLRSWRQGAARHNAFLEDVAGLAVAYLSLYQADPDPTWYQHAVRLVDEMRSHYTDPQGGFFDTRDDQEAIITRPKEVQDNATPSGNALAVHALLELSSFTGNGELRDLAESALGSLQQALARYPTAFGYWLSTFDMAVGPVLEIALLGEPSSAGLQAMQQEIFSGYLPRSVVAASSFPPPPGSPPLLNERALLDGQPTAYVCTGFVCQRPVNSPVELRQQLDAESAPG